MSGAFDSDELGDGKVLPFRPIRDRLEEVLGEPVALEKKYDTSYEVDLDDPDQVAKPVPVDPLPDAVEWRPIIPAHLRTVTGLRSVASRNLRWLGHHAGWHAARLPLHLLLAAFWAVVGVFKLAGRQLRWWWQPEAVRLESEAANDNDAMTWAKVRKDAQARRSFRAMVLGAELVALAVGVGLLWWRCPWWLVALVAAVVVPMLARVGRPAGRPIIGSAVVKPRFRQLRADIVLRAYYAAGLGHPEKVDQQVEFGGRMSRDAMDTGSQVVVDLPFGKTFADVVTAKGKLASGLDVTEFQVFLTRDRTSIRRHLLFVADRDPLAIPAGRAPMLDCKPRNIWTPCPMGLDERGRRVRLDLMWNSVLIGAQPRKGKTFTVRALALYAALDPWVKIFGADGRNSPDWRSFALVADRLVFGRDPAAIEKFVDMLRMIRKHIDRVGALLSEIAMRDPAACPEGKLTPELARDPRYPELRVWLLFIEEFQVYFETEDQETNKEIAGHLSDIQARGPANGVVLLSSSQKPSGVGAGDVGRLFNRYRDNHPVRIALRCGNRDVSMAVLGGDAYQEGYDASAIPVGPEYRGVGYLYGATDDTPLTRFYLADGQDAEKILRAARAHRERLSLLSGEAAGDVVLEGELVDPLADALSVIAPT